MEFLQAPLMQSEVKCEHIRLGGNMLGSSLERLRVSHIYNIIRHIYIYNILSLVRQRYSLFGVCHSGLWSCSEGNSPKHKLNNSNFWKATQGSPFTQMRLEFQGSSSHRGLAKICRLAMGDDFVVKG